MVRCSTKSYFNFFEHYFLSCVPY